MRGTRELERRESKLVEYVRGVERGRMQLLLWPVSRSVFFLLLLLLSASDSQSYRHFISLHVNSPQFMTIASCFPADCTCCASIQRITMWILLVFGKTMDFSRIKMIYLGFFSFVLPNLGFWIRQKGRRRIFLDS